MIVAPTRRYTTLRVQMGNFEIVGSDLNARFTNAQIKSPDPELPTPQIVSPPALEDPYAKDKNPDPTVKTV